MPSLTELDRYKLANQLREMSSIFPAEMDQEDTCTIASQIIAGDVNLDKTALWYVTRHAPAKQLLADAGYSVEGL
jgi:hypothetical protein